MDGWESSQTTVTSLLTTGSRMRETSGDVAAWPDAWLVEAVRRDPPDEAALEALADRHWRPLFGRCRLLALNDEKASDLAQEAWYRVLRARHRLDPQGNFPAYLAATAMNIWRDWHRSARRAGPMADHRLASLDAALPGADGGRPPLAEAVPDLSSLDLEEQNALKLDIDEALGRLSPRSREVLVARFLVGESCADIGRRHGRTEQTASSWVRQALEEIRLHLGEENMNHGGRVDHEQRHTH
jgi:RNA polymerase sigma-70 factor (ECF subfamily)